MWLDRGMRRNAGGDFDCFLGGIAAANFCRAGFGATANAAHSNAAKGQTRASQAQYRQSLSSMVNALCEQIPVLVAVMRKAVQPHEAELQRIVMLSDSYEDSPRVLEGLNNFLVNMQEGIQAAMEPVEEAHTTPKISLQKG